jgi:pyruvate ferredoxin oxidoreductase alpha subunit
MNRTLLTGNQAAAWGARLSGMEYAPFFPITPQTEIMETIAGWIDRGEFKGRLVTLDSEHSMVTAAGAAAATGVRVFTATSSQGLLYAMEMVYTVPGWRVPFVMVNVSRGLSSPITLEPDHNDIMAARDSGFLQMHCSTCQEVLDAVLFSYRIAEHPHVRLPVLVNMDGFYLSFTREPVLIPDEASATAFVGPFNPENSHFTPSAPSSLGVAVLGGTPYSYFRYQAHLASLNALEIFDDTALEFEQAFGRKPVLLEAFRTEDAELVFVMIGSFATKAKNAVNRLRDEGWKIGLVRPCLIRPFPSDAIFSALAGIKGVAVVDQNLAAGKGGILYGEITGTLYGRPDAPPVITSFIGGLGGRDISIEEFREMAVITRNALETGIQPPPRLLFTKSEMESVKKMQAIALGTTDHGGKGHG